MSSLLQIPFRTLDGQPRTLGDYPARAWLLVNTASQCGFTPQYEGLERLWRRYGSQGLMVIGFPCDQFGHQEPGDAQQIADFCTRQYEVSFPLAEKIAVKGDAAHPLFERLTQAAPGFLLRQVKWNFTKFLVSDDGARVQRFAPITKPQALERDIRALLAP